MCPANKRLDLKLIPFFVVVAVVSLCWKGGKKNIALLWVFKARARKTLGQTDDPTRRRSFSFAGPGNDRTLKITKINLYTKVPCPFLSLPLPLMWFQKLSKFCARSVFRRLWQGQKATSQRGAISQHRKEDTD